MTIIKNIYFMALTSVVRLASGLLTFTIMARLLGPESYGIVMLWLSVTTLISLASNYGLTAYILKEIGSNPAKAQMIMSEVLSAKIFITVVVLFTAFTALPLFNKSDITIYILLLFSQLLDSATDFLNVGYRATNRYNIETRIAIASSILHFGVLVGIIWQYQTAISAAFAYLLSRLAALAMTWISMRYYFGALKPSTLAKAWKRIRAARSFATDFMMQNMFGQIDSLVLNYFIGPAAVGIYQAGMKVFISGSQVATVLGNVFIPSASHAYSTSNRVQFVLINIQLAFITTGAIGAMLFLGLPEQITSFIYGKKFAELSSYLPLFGILFLIRFLAAGWGITLTISGRQGVRSAISLLHWLILLIVAVFFVPKYGISGWLYSLILGNFLLALAYLAVAVRIGVPNVFSYALAKFSNLIGV